MTTAALLRNKGTKKSKTGTYYLNNGILFGTMYIRILRNFFLSGCKNTTLKMGCLASIVFISIIYSCVEPSKKLKMCHVKKVHPSKVDISKDIDMGKN